MNMVNTITFKNIVKLIHPDINPDIDDASGKLNKIILYRKNEEALYDFAEKWGLINVPPKRKQPNRIDNIIRIGDIVLILNKDIRAKCVKLTPKRVYYEYDNKITFCLRKNALKVS